jgi:2'-5' RNA ligase
MQDGSNSAMVALLPITTDWCRIQCPHMTLVYVGEVDDLKPNVHNELAKDASTLAMLAKPLTLEVTGVDMFGPQKDTMVLTLRPNPELLAMRKMMEDWNGSEFEFNPHVTVGPASSYLEVVPKLISFDRVMVGWGKDQMVFNLKY